MPILLFHGTDDRLVDYRGTEQIYAIASSEDKELHLFDGLFHETMNELPADREKVLDIVSKWILNRVKKKKPAAKAKSAKSKKVPSKVTKSKAKKSTKASKTKKITVASKKKSKSQAKGKATAKKTSSKTSTGRKPKKKK